MPRPHGRAAALATLVAALSLTLGQAEALAQGTDLEDDLYVLAEGSEGPIALRMFLCGPACGHMRLDMVDGSLSMITRIFPVNGLPQGQFAMVDHGKKTIDLIRFNHVALADVLMGARKLPDGNMFENFLATQAGLSGLRATGATRTFNVRDLNRDQITQFEAQEYTFVFDYEVNMFPGADQIPKAQLQAAGMPEMKFQLRMEGTTWAAPSAPGSAQLAVFYGMMGRVLGFYSNALSGQQLASGQTLGMGDMTSRMTEAMAAIASKGMPLSTTTSSKIVPMTGASAGMQRMITSMLPSLDFGTTESRVVGIGTQRVLDPGPDLPGFTKWLDFDPEAASYPANYTINDLSAQIDANFSQQGYEP